MSQDQEYCTIDEAASQLGTTPLNILMHLKRGLLAGHEADGGWQIETASVRGLLDKRSQGEKPDVVCASGCAKTHGCGGCK